MISKTIYYHKKQFKFIDVRTYETKYICYEEWHNPTFEKCIEVGIHLKQDGRFTQLLNVSFHLLEREKAIHLFNEYVESEKKIADICPHMQVIYDEESSTIIKKAVKEDE